MRRSYHHGDLFAALLDEAAAAIREAGVEALSLRELARRAGVSHAAPAHHFGDKTGLLTALATQGFERFYGALEAALPGDDEGRFLRAGLAYVRFALAHPAHFQVMFRPGLVHEADERYLGAKARALELLLREVRASHAGALKRGVSAETLSLAAWSSVHGLVTLWLDDNLRGIVDRSDAEGLARRVLGLLDAAVRRV